MMIRVIAVSESGPRARITFETLGGGGHAGWSGPVPEVGSEHHVELGIGDALVWGVNLGPATDGPAFRENGGALAITGALEIAGPDGGTALRVLGSLVLVDLPQPWPAAGAPLTLMARDVTLFPYTL